MTTTEEAPKSPLFEAIDKNDTEAALALLKTKEQAAQRDPSGMSVLAAAAYRYAPLKRRRLLYPRRLFKGTYRNPLNFRGNLTLVEKAIELKCDVNDKTDGTLYTPLMFAALSGRAKIF